MPQVSTIIPAYNAAPWIAAAIESALTQSVPQEILVVDDGSTDETAAVARRYGAPVEVISQPNAGVSSARNLGLARARGEFIAFLDADDVWLPGKLGRQLDAFKRFPAAGTAITDEVQVDENGRVLRQSFFAILPFFTELPVQTSIAAKPFTWLAQAGFLPTSAVLTRATVAREAGWFDESMSIVEDRDYWFRLVIAAPLAIVPEVMVRYLVRRSGLTKAGHALLARNIERVLERYRETLLERMPAEGTDPRAILGAVYLKLALELWYREELADAARLFRRAASFGRHDFLRWLAAETRSAGALRALRQGLASLRQ
jgi:glycosyltransferase involved in cell wall biosynthesis